MGDDRGQAATFGLACLASLVVSPLAWGHYYVMVLPAVIFAPLWLENRGHPLAAKAIAAFLPMLTWTHYVLMRWSGPIGVLGLGTTLWFLAVSITILLVRDPQRQASARFPSSLRADESHTLVGRDLPILLRPELQQAERHDSARPRGR